MLKYYSPLGVASTKKKDNSPVTQADLEINTLVINEVAKNYPDYRVLAEEESNNEVGSKKLFVVDPLDGTLTFTIGSPQFCFSAAVVINGKSIAGVLYNPLARRTLLAEEGQGTWLVEENKQVFVSQKDSLDQSLINTGWRDARLAQILHPLGVKTPAFYAICEIGSLIALGGMEAAVFTGLQAHDIAAVKIVVEEAGGKVTDIFGREQRYDGQIRGAIISNGPFHNELIKLTEQSGLAADLEKRANDF